MLWQETFNGNGNGNDYGIQLKINGNNEIFVAAALQGTTSVNFGVLKYSPDGTLGWSNTWDGTSNGIDVPADIDLDDQDNIYLAGCSEASNNLSDYAVVKFAPDGSYVWQSTYDYVNLTDIATSMEIDANYVIVTGASASASTNWDYTTLKIDPSNGTISGTSRIPVPGLGLDNALAVTADNNNNIYITGYVEVNGNKNIQTVKIDGNFGLEWVRDYDGGLDDVAKSIGVDIFGNIYITGYTEKPNNGKKYITIKYDAQGTKLWMREFGSAGGAYTACAEKLALADNNGDVIIIGTIEKNGLKDIGTIAYDQNGNLVFVREFDNNNADDEAESVVIEDNNIYVSGTSLNNGVKTIFTIKYSVRDKAFNPIYENGVVSHNEGELTICFNKSAINYTTIDNLDFEAGLLSDFVKPEVLDEMENSTDIHWYDLNTYKIYRWMTSSDTVSISRLGDPVTIPDFWTTLSVELPPETIEQDIADILNTLKGAIRFAEKNYIGQLGAAPNDPLYLSGQSGLYSQTHGINAEQAWDKQTGQTYIKVGVFDSGINWRHEDFGYGGIHFKLGKSFDFLNWIEPWNQTNPDILGHGTACAGIIGALRNNGLGVAGVAGGDILANPPNRGSQLHSLKIGDNIFALYSVISSAIVEGSVDILNGGYGLHVQNHSWYGPYNGNDLRKAVMNCYRNGCSFVACSGNDALSTKYYPASFNENWVMKVGGNDASGEWASAFSTHSNWLDFIAPGTPDIYKTTDHNNNSGYSFSQHGTSFAAPHVSGTAALLYSEHYPNNNSAYPNVLSPEDIEEMLKRSATDTPPSIGPDPKTGHGRINADLALTKTSLPYRIHHFQHTAPTSTATSFLSNINLVCPEGIYFPGLPIYTYTYKANVYKLTSTFNHSIPSNETYEAGWVRNSVCGPYANTNFIWEPHWAGVTLNSSSHNSATLEGYIYEIFIYQGSNHVATTWRPTDLNGNVEFGYSIYTIDNTYNIDEEQDLNNAFNLYPNPANNEIGISYILDKSSEVSFKIYNTIGQLMLTHNFGKQNQGNFSNVIDVTKLSKGLYLANLIVGNKTISKRFIKN